MRDRDWTTERACCLLAASLLLNAAACSRPEARPAGAIGAPSPSPAAPSIASATPAASTTPAGDALAIDPTWVASDPQLTRLLSGATPACALKDTFMADRDGSVVRGYEVYAPALEQAVIERRFRAAAQALGYAATRRHEEFGFQDEARQISAAIYDAHARVLVGRAASARESARQIATKLGFETWTLVEALGGAWTWMTVQRSAGNAADLEVRLPVTSAARPAIEAWARDKKLAADGDAWVRKARADAPVPSRLFIEIGKNGEIFILETRGEPLVGPACRDHPTRAVEAGSPDLKKPSQTEDELIRQMMGK